MIERIIGHHPVVEEMPARSRARWFAALSTSDAERPSGWIQAIVLLPFVVLIYASLLLDDATVSWLLPEEHPIELLGALGLLAAGIACLVLWRRVRRRSSWPFLRRFSLLALAALFVFGFGEEISWGQRIFGYGTPESLAEANAQGETNVHNLAALGGWLNMDRMFQVFWLLIGVVIPLLALWARPRRFLQRLVPILPVALAGLFVLNQILTKALHDAFVHDPGLWNSTKFGFTHGIFETKETVSCVLLATGFWLLVLRDRASSRGNAQEPDPPHEALQPRATGEEQVAGARTGPL